MKVTSRVHATALFEKQNVFRAPEKNRESMRRILEYTLHYTPAYDTSESEKLANIVIKFHHSIIC